jgi:cell fate (sporulation/competence/biofilm development) regulator YmcA (YheA/YmcA/DUF963 family)
MSRRFCFQASLDNERYVILEDLPFSTYKDLIKVLMDNNPLIVNSFIDEVIEDCVVGSNFDIHVPNLSVLDKLILLLIIKSYSVASDIKFKITCSETEKQFDYTVNVNNIIMLLLKLQINNNHTIEYEKLKINFKMPCHFNQYSRTEAMSNWISSIELEGNETPITDEIRDKLPLDITKEFEDFITNENKKLVDNAVISYKSPFSKKINNLYLSMFDDSLLSFINLIFQADLLDLYETEYFLIKDHNFNQQLFDRKSPAEIYAYISIIEKYKEDTTNNPAHPGELFTGDSIDNDE